MQKTLAYYKGGGELTVKEVKNPLTQTVKTVKKNGTVPEVFQRSKAKIVMVKTRPSKKVSMKDIYKQKIKYLKVK